MVAVVVAEAPEQVRVPEQALQAVDQVVAEAAPVAVALAADQAAQVAAVAQAAAEADPAVPVEVAQVVAEADQQDL